MTYPKIKKNRLLPTSTCQCAVE